VIFPGRNPVLIERYQLAHPFHKNIFGHRRHLHAFGRNIETFVIVVWPENKSLPRFALIGFNTFKNSLPVMQGSQRWTDHQWLIRFYLHIFPFTILIIRFQHVICKGFAKRNVFKGNARQPAMFNFCHRDTISFYHNPVFLSRK
jgi:hypothetical protein